MNSGEFLWKNQFTIPGLKPNSPKNRASSYRPISLTSLMGKNMERIVLDEMIPFLERNSIISLKQHGFKRKHSCLTQLIEHHNIIINAILEGKNIDTIYTDFQKAFDKCDIFMAAHAIKKAGIQGQLGVWILDFMSGWTQYVLVNNKLSRGEKVLSGVPQGSILGPIVFIIAIQSLAELDLDGIVEMFADDTKDSIIITNENDAEKLQSDLVKLNEQTTTFGMTFNSDKCQCLKSGPNFEIKTQYTYFSPDLESLIEDKDIVKDLGIYLSSDWAVQ